MWVGNVCGWVTSVQAVPRRNRLVFGVSMMGFALAGYVLAARVFGNFWVVCAVASVKECGGLG